MSRNVTVFKSDVAQFEKANYLANFAYANPFNRLEEISNQNEKDKGREEVRKRIRHQ